MDPVFIDLLLVVGAGAILVGILLIRQELQRSPQRLLRREELLTTTLQPAYVRMELDVNGALRRARRQPLPVATRFPDVPCLRSASPRRAP